jgi:hypothetical protein
MRKRLTELETEFAGIRLTVTGNIYTKPESAVMYYSDMSGNLLLMLNLILIQYRKRLSRDKTHTSEDQLMR